MSCQWGLETDFDMVRFVWSNNSASPYTIALCKAAPSSALGDGSSPVNSLGAIDYTLFQTMTFNNAGLDVAPQDQTAFGSGPTTFTVPGNAGSLLHPTRWYSDWLRIASIARTDGGVLPLLVTRTLSNDLAGTYRMAGMVGANWSPLAQDRILNGVTKPNADQTTVPVLLAGSVSQGTSITPDGIQYMTRSPGFTVLGVGDSLTQGAGSTALYQPWGYLSCLALSTPARPISFWNQGWQGMLSPDYWGNGYTALKGSVPDVATIPVWTPNDAQTQVAADAAWSRAMDLANYAMKHGTVPVLMGPVPWSGIATGAIDNIRLGARTRMLQAGANGMAVLDWEAVIGTGAVPNRIQPVLIAADNQHPNDAGNALMDSAVFRPVLANILRV